MVVAGSKHVENLGSRKVKTNIDKQKMGKKEIQVVKYAQLPSKHMYEHTRPGMNEWDFNVATQGLNLWANIVPINDVDMQVLSIEEQVALVDYIRQYKQPNVIGAKVPLRSNWNLNLARQLATSNSDREVVCYLTYG